MATKPTKRFVAFYSDCGDLEQCEYLTHGATLAAVKSLIQNMIHDNELEPPTGDSEILIMEVVATGTSSIMNWR